MKEDDLDPRLMGDYSAIKIINLTNQRRISYLKWQRLKNLNGK